MTIVRRSFFHSILLSFPLLVTACGEGSSDPVVEPRSMVLFDSCQDLVSYARVEIDRMLEQSYKRNGSGAFPGTSQGDMEEPESAGDSEDDGDAAPGPSSPKGESPKHSNTNVQEAGVDEPDLVKTDGQRMYSLSRGVLRILDVSGEKAQLTDRLEIGGPQGRWHQAEMLMHGNKVLIVNQNQNFATTPENYQAGFRITEVDVSVPGQAKVVSSLDLEGRYVSARKIGSVVRLVFTTLPKDLKLRRVYHFFPENGVHEKDHNDAPPQVEEASSKEEVAQGWALTQTKSYEQVWEEAAQKARIYNRKVLAQMTEHNLLPRYRFSTPGAPVQAGLAYGCEQTMRPGVSAGVELLSVLTVDLNAGLKPGNATAVVASGSTVYASGSSLYVATRSWMPGFDDEDMVADGDMAGGTTTGVVMPGTGIATAGTVVTSGAMPGSDAVQDATGEGEPDKPQARQATLPPEPDQTSRRQTYVHKFDLSDPLRATYRASGLVNGELLNQFAMSEHQGVLRVAATRYLKNSWRPTDNFVATLQEQGDKLVQLGQAGGLGKTEMIRSVRFMGDVGYVVTFRQTDPLYTLDLKNPAAPQVLGELKIEGFSAYLHPLSPGYLMGVGRDADHEGRIKGLQVSIFDVTDLRNPRRIHNYTMENTTASTQFDHRAFLYWPENKTVVLPVQGHRRVDEQNYEDFAMALVLGVDPQVGITKRAEIAHPTTEHHYPGMEKPYIQATAIDRTLVIGDRLWTLSHKGAKACKLSDAAPLDWLSYE